MLKTKQATSPIIKHVQSRGVTKPDSALSSHITTQTEQNGDAASPIDHALLEQSAAASTSLKRKASSPPAHPAPLDKRAKSTHDGPPWPRHMYMTCFRSYPIFSGDVGMLHIDVGKATVWFEGWYGKPHNRKFERKQCDLRDPFTKLQYNPIRKPGIDGATHDLALFRPNGKGGIIRIIDADCAAPGWEVWGSEKAWEEDEPNDKKNLLPSVKVIIDAIIHCIDRTSRRQAVHDPDAMHALLDQNAQYQKGKNACTLTSMDILNWEFTRDELKNRKKCKAALVICDMRDEPTKTGSGALNRLAEAVERLEDTLLPNRTQDGGDPAKGKVGQ